MPDLRELAETALHEAYMGNGETSARNALLAALDGRRCATCAHADPSGDGWLTCLRVNDEGAMFSTADDAVPALIVRPDFCCREWTANEGATRREEV